ncbi:MAG: methyl-accepting chemotaxis protein [Rhodocyclales bacterium]|nr:methyl-accepting chemotaxis protein [Rhodocyclales bacterium]
MIAKLPIRHRLWLLIAGALVFWSAASLYSLSVFRADMLEARRAKTRAQVEQAYSIADYYGRQAKEGKMEEAAARDMAQTPIANLRYDGDNYFSQYDTEYRMLRHPFKPEMNGKDQSQLKDKQGTPIVVAIVDAAKRSQGEFVHYLWPRPGQQTPVEKLALGKLYAPWGMIIASGIYIDDLDQEIRRQAATIGGAIGVCLLVLLLFSWRVAHGISHPLESLRETIVAIAREGDLRRRAAVRGGGEIGDIAAAFDSLIERLQAILREVASSKGAVESATSRLVAATSAVEQGSAAQSEAASAGASAAEEISVSVNQVSQDIGEVAEVAAETRDQTRSGREVVGQAGSEMAEISRQIGDTAHLVLQLGEESQRISDIVQAIRGIADQTNLLALNAAIEAARAGEAGRGFAVVADEVRKLAERTSLSTQEITTMIEAIQSGTGAAVERIRTLSEQAQQGVALANAAAESVGRIDDGSARVSTVIADIAAAAREQNRATEDIARSIERISRMSDENAAAVTQAAAIVRELEATSGQLAQSMQQFQL